MKSEELEKFGAPLTGSVNLNGDKENETRAATYGDENSVALRVSHVHHEDGMESLYICESHMSRQEST